MSSIFKKVFIVVFAFSTLTSALAGFWDSFIPYQGPKKDVITLIITANYKHPLLIAQLVQDEIKQPYLLLPTASGKGVFFNPPRKRSEAALEIREGNLARFIRFLNPKQIVILGDTRYVSEEYLEMIDKDIPLITITGNNWQRIADRIEILLAACNVGYDYKKLSQQLNSGLYKPTAVINKVPADLPPKDSEDILVEETVVKETAVNETAVDKKDAAAVETGGTDKKAVVKEPEAVMPKSTPKLIKDK